jgi:hypothetical protein
LFAATFLGAVCEAPDERTSNLAVADDAPIDARSGLDDHAPWRPHRVCAVCDAWNQDYEGRLNKVGRQCDFMRFTKVFHDSALPPLRGWTIE